MEEWRSPYDVERVDDHYVDTSSRRPDDLLRTEIRTLRKFYGGSIVISTLRGATPRSGDTETFSSRSRRTEFVVNDHQPGVLNNGAIPVFFR